jgi:phosphopantetheinyl transferase (holo-ACP synthase)
LILPTIPTAVLETATAAAPADAGPVSNQAAIATCKRPLQAALAIGIDMEHPDCPLRLLEPRSDPFYVENCSGSEIAHCLHQPDPRLSFCGLWPAKEAVEMCGREFASLRPKDIEVLHDETRRPTVRITRAALHTALSACVVSSSHSGKACLAVCVKTPPPGRV